MEVRKEGNFFNVEGYDPENENHLRQLVEKTKAELEPDEEIISGFPLGSSLTFSEVYGSKIKTNSFLMIIRKNEKI